MYGRPRFWITTRTSSFCLLVCSVVVGILTKAAVSNMSSPPNGRALALPVVWGTEKESRISGPQSTEVRSPSDEDLMAWIQASDSRGLDLLYTRYAKLVFGIAYRIVNDRSEAEEVVQETFFSLYQKASLFDPCQRQCEGLAGSDCL